MSYYNIESGSVVLLYCFLRCRIIILSLSQCSIIVLSLAVSYYYIGFGSVLLY